MPPDPAVDVMGTPALRTVGLSKSYGPHVVLDEVTIGVAPGEIAVVSGSNGTGKSTLLRCVAGLTPFRGEASVKTWLHRIAVHVAHKYLRSPSHRGQPLDDEAEHAPGETPEARVARDEIARRLYVHLDKLDARKRVALVLYVLEDLSIAEVAALTGASQTATKSRIFFARRALLLL